MSYFRSELVIYRRLSEWRTASDTLGKEIAVFCRSTAHVVASPSVTTYAWVLRSQRDPLSDSTALAGEQAWIIQLFAVFTKI